MTVTDLLSAQSVGTGANAGTNLYASHTTLQAATSGLQVQCQFTAGATPAPGTEIRVWVAVSAFSVSSGIPGQFQRTAQMFAVPISAVGPAGIVVGQSEFILNVGGEAYVWFEVPTLAVAGSLNAKLVEI